MKAIVTGAAGFIGSNVVRMLNDRGVEDIIIVDNINISEKWRNISNKKYIEYIPKKEFLARLEEFKTFTHIIHMGACSATTETDFDYLYKNNYEYSKELWNFAANYGMSYIYASSAATYGSKEIFDDKQAINDLMPLNRYGYSKQIFDLWTLKQKKKPKQYVGLKFFNVYGPNEYAKGNMASVIFHGFKQIQEKGKIGLFKSYKKEYEDGEQLRDFVYVKDVISVIEYFIDNVKYNGIYNVGTGKAESFNTLAKSIFHALNIEERIEYIEMPETLRDKYQYFTEADITKLRSIGYTKEFYNLTEGAKDYVTNYLVKDMKIN